MRIKSISLFALLAISLFAISAFAQPRSAPQAASELVIEDTEGSGEEDIQARPGPAPRIATTENEERQEVNEGDEDGDSRYGTGGN
ncbi:MAG: hypothetical protein ACJAYU_000231 [Bradymonadia bacterium]|jgi:hypothetical protein